MNKYKQFKNVTFAPPDPDRRAKLSQSLEAVDLEHAQPWDGDLEENEEDWIVIWHGVRITDEKTASRIMKTETAKKTYVTVNPKYLSWVTEQINKRNTWWVRFKRWLLTLFQFRQ